jgi:hypothetical protein
MAVFKFENFIETTVSASIAIGATTIQVAPSAAASMPVLGVAERFVLILDDGNQNPEIVHVTENPGNGNLTVLRGQEGTAATSWQVGTLAIHTLTKESIQWFTTGGSEDWKNELLAQMAAMQAQIDALQGELDDLEDLDNQQNLNLTSQLGDAFSQVQVISIAQSDLESAFATYQVSLNAQFASFSASINSQLTVLTTSTTANATAVTTLQAQMGTVQGQITSILSVNVTQGNAIVTLQNDLSAQSTNFGARITTLESLRITDNAAVASSISTLNASVGSLSATVTTTQTAVATISGNLTATWGFNLDAGGNIVSFEALASTGSRADVKWGANQFIINTAGGDKIPFTYDAINSTLTVQNLKVLGTLIYAGTVDSTPLAANATFQMGTAFATSSVTAHTPGVVGFGPISTGITPIANSQVIIFYNVWIEPRLEVDITPTGVTQYPVTVTLRRNGSVLGSAALEPALWIDENTNNGTWILPGGMKMMIFRDASPLTGVVSVYEVSIDNTGDFAFSFDYRQIVLVEHKR